MKCHKARNLVWLYLDSEIDAQTSLEVEQHLESCPECTRLFEAEKKTEKRIVAALCHGQRTPNLWRDVEAQIVPVRRFPRLTPVWKLATAMVAVVLVSLLLWPRERPLDMASSAEKCHRAYVEHFVSAEFTGPLPDELARKMNGRLDAAAFSYIPSQATFNYEGARVDHISGVPAALILGHSKGIPVSLLVFNKSELKYFPMTQQRLEAGTPVVCADVGRYHFAVRLLNDHVICAIGEVSMAQLEDLVKSVRFI